MGVAHNLVPDMYVSTCKKFGKTGSSSLCSLMHFQCLSTNACFNFQTHVYKRPAVFSRPLIFATAFMSFFSVVIALFKVNSSFQY